MELEHEHDGMLVSVYYPGYKMPSMKIVCDLVRKLEDNSLFFYQNTGTPKAKVYENIGMVPGDAYSWYRVEQDAISEIEEFGN